MQRNKSVYCLKRDIQIDLTNVIILIAQTVFCFLSFYELVLQYDGITTLYLLYDRQYSQLWFIWSDRFLSQNLKCKYPSFLYIFNFLKLKRLKLIDQFLCSINWTLINNYFENSFLEKCTTLQVQRNDLGENIKESCQK